MTYSIHPTNQPRPSHLAQRGFTLLEMLVVLVIIGMLAAFIGPRLFGNVEKAAVTAAGAQVKMLRGAVETFRLDVGR